MATVEALLGGKPSAAEAADMDSIAAIWVLMAETIRDAANGVESARRRRGRPDGRGGHREIVEARKVFPGLDVAVSGVKPKWKRKGK